MPNVTTAKETNVITAAQMKQVREVDFVTQFAHKSLAKLIEVLGVTRKIPMMEGTTMYVYTVKGTLQSGAVPEGEIIPLSQYETEKTPIGEITLDKYRKAVTAEAIKKSGYNAAVRDTDQKMLRDVQNTIRARLFGFLNGEIDGAPTARGDTLQKALAAAWGQIQDKYEDDSAEAVYFVNPLDIAEYLGAANITTQTAFGMTYIEDFLGLGTVITSSRITRGTFLATAKQNIIMYYLTMSGDVASAFSLTVDDLGYIGIKSGYQNEERAQIESLVMCGIQFLVEYAAGVVKGIIGSGAPTLGKLTVSSVAGTRTGDTKLTVTEAKKDASDKYKYKVGDAAEAVTYGQNVQSWTPWDGTADITAETGKTLTLVECSSDYKAVAAGSCSVTAKAED